MAWLRRAPEDAAASSSRRSSSRERCRKQSCATKLNDLKSETKELESQLKPLQRLFNSEVDDTCVKAFVRLLASQNPPNQ